MDTPLIGLPNTSFPKMPVQGPSAETTEASAGDERAKEEAKLKQAAQAFEGYFIYMLMKEMQKTSSKEGGLFGSGAAGETYQYLFQQAMSNKLASANGGFGLTKMMMREFNKRAAPAAAGGALPLVGLEKPMPLHPTGNGVLQQMSGGIPSVSQDVPTPAFPDRPQAASRPAGGLRPLPPLGLRPQSFGRVDRYE